MLAGVLFGIVAARLDASRAKDYLASNAAVARDLGLSKDATDYHNAVTQLESVQTVEHDAKRIAEFLAGNPGVVRDLELATDSDGYKRAVAAITAAVPDDKLALFIATNPEVAPSGSGNWNSKVS